MEALPPHSLGLRAFHISHIRDGSHGIWGDHHHHRISAFICCLDKVGKWDNSNVLVPRLFKFVLHLRVFR
jgi:hypothetical protein